MNNLDVMPFWVFKQLYLYWCYFILLFSLQNNFLNIFFKNQVTKSGCTLGTTEEILKDGSNKPKFVQIRPDLRLLGELTVSVARGGSKKSMPMKVNVRIFNYLFARRLTEIVINSKKQNPWCTPALLALESPRSHLAAHMLLISFCLGPQNSTYCN